MSSAAGSQFEHLANTPPRPAMRRLPCA